MNQQDPEVAAAIRDSLAQADTSDLSPGTIKSMAQQALAELMVNHSVVNI